MTRKADVSAAGAARKAICRPTPALNTFPFAFHSPGFRGG